MSKRTVSSVVLAILMIASFDAFSQTAPKGKKSAKEKEAPVQVQEEPKSNAAEIEFVKTVHDYGTIYEGGNGECEFEFKNVGREPLVLSNVTSSCGCTVPSWPKEPIMPGKTGVIKVKYNTSRIGAINKTVTVMSNAEQNPKVELRITGTVKPKQEESYPEKPQSPMESKP
jgi:hypothetical protein